VAEYLDVNGVHTWFDEVGDGDPVVLLHGGLTDSQEFALITPAIAAEFRTYLPERRGHGHTPDVDGPISYDLMADDTIAFLEATVERAAHLVGHSDGANVALLVALKRPDLVRRLVLISANFHHDGLVPGAIEVDHLMGMVAGHYAAVSPDGAEHLPIVGAKVGRMFDEEPTLTVADLAGVRARTLVMCADDDAVTLEHTVALYRGIPRSELAVVPGTSHVLVLEKPELCHKLIVDFLTTDAPPTFWPLRRSELLHDPAG
jgi:pimeloyl-ACP methyl ester carboxylesterase